MPKVRVVNPRSSRVRRASRKRMPRRNTSGRFVRRKRARKNPVAGGGELLLMNPKRRRSRKRSSTGRYRRRRRSRKSNPTSYKARKMFNPRRRVRRRAAVVPFRCRRRASNPFGLPGGDILKTAAWAIAGGVATRALPQMFLSQYNTGIMGYGMNLATAAGLAWVGERFLGSNASRGILIGGLVMVGGRIISDYFGKDVVTFGGGLLGAYGDPSFDLGLYEANQFVVPTVSDGRMQMTDYSKMLPQPVAVVPAAGKGAKLAGMGDQNYSGPASYPAGTGRLASRFAS